MPKPVAPAAAPAAPKPATPTVAPAAAPDRLAALESGHTSVLDEVRSLRSLVEQRLSAAPAVDFDALMRRPLAGLDERLAGVTKTLGEVSQQAEARASALLQEVQSLKSAMPKGPAPAGISPKDVDGALDTLRTTVGKLVEDRTGAVAKLLGDVRAEASARQAALLDELKTLKGAVQKPASAPALSAKDLDTALGRLRAAVDKAVEERAETLRNELAETRRVAEGKQGSVLEAVRTLHAQVDRLLAPPALDDELEASVISLRRLLSELLEQRMESVMKALADARSDAAGSDGSSQRVIERLDQVLQSLGAIGFVAEPMDIVDPVFHAVVEERSVDGVPGGLVVATIRPGYRTARGRVLCKAAVAVSRS